MNEIDKKFESLKTNLKSLESVIVAFSGGVDSTFLLKTAHLVLGKNATAVTATSSTYPLLEFKESIRLAKEIGCKQITIESEELDIPEFKNNPTDRCYYCKGELFRKLKKIALERTVKHVLDGTNLDDTNDHRPGMKAANELNVKSPLMDAKLTKSDIRELSKRLNIDTWDKPSFACLASRFPYGDTITKKKLETVDAAETFLRKIGFRQVRVRHHGDIARIEIDKENQKLALQNGIQSDIINRFKELGFTYVTLDLEGYRTGSMNETLNETNTV